MVFLTSTLPQFLLLLLLVFSPLLFGSVHVWAYCLSALVSLVILALGMLGWCFRSSHVRLTFPAIHILLILFIGFSVFQMIPIDENLVKTLNPEVWSYQDRAGNLPAGDGLTLSLATFNTRAELIRFLPGCALFVFLVNALPSRSQMTRIVVTVLITGSFVSIYGMWGKLEGDFPIWWWNNPYTLSRLTGTYINPDNAAGYFEMTALLAMGFFVSFFRRNGNGGHSEASSSSWLDELRGMLGSSRGLHRQMLVVAVFGVVMVGLFLTASRGGFIGFLAGATVLMGISMRRLKIFNLTLLGVVVAGIVLVFFNTLETDTLEQMGTRYKSLVGGVVPDMMRLKMYDSMIPLVETFPIFGTGLGTFPEVYPAFQPVSINLHFLHAHNDWAQILIETGLVGLVLVLLMAVTYLRLALFQIGQRRDPYALGLGLGALGGMIAVATHSVVDFPLHIQSNFYLFSVLAGVGLCALHNTKTGPRESYFPPVWEIRLPWVVRLLVFIPLIAVLVWCGKKVLDHGWAEIKCPTQINSTMELEKSMTLETIKEGLKLEPDNASCMIRLVDAYQDFKKLQPAKVFKPQYTAESISKIKEAIRLNPSKGRWHIYLAREYFYLSLLEPQRAGHWLDLSVQSYRNGYFFNPRMKLEILKATGLWNNVAQQLPRGPLSQLYLKHARRLKDI